ncbi:MAG: S49 family peptidase [Candidatus Nanohaloarchaea archaeon]
MKKLTTLITITVLLTTAATAFNLSSIMGQNTGTVALVQLQGSISSGSSGLGSTGITPEKIRDINQKIKQRNFDAAIYEWNSGGGAVVASKEIKRSIEDVKVPTVCRFRDVAASGAYLASLGCDRIVADSASLTGSIGVKSSYLEYSGLLDKLGVEYVNISAGKNKELGSRFQNASKKDVRILKQKAEKIHEEFVQMVEQERNLSDSQVEEVRTAEIFLGEKAKQLGLVDEIGGRETAANVAENLTDKKLRVEKIQTRQPFSFLSLMSSSVKSFLGASETPIQAEWP